MCARAGSKALECHERVRHRVRLGIKAYLHTAQCPCCGVDLRERARLLAHLSDRRRPWCARWVRRHVPPMSRSALAKLDEELRVARLEGRRAGCSHPRAVRPALLRGREVGRR